MRLTIRDLGKRYRGIQALAGVTLEIGHGVLGLLGPNGAGKTTLMNVVATLTRPSAGTVLWDGVDVHGEPEALRRVLGYLPQDFGVYPNLTAPEFLEYLAAVKGLPRAGARRRIDALLEALNLSTARKRLLGSYSGGMKQRVGIAQALLNDPQLLIVDEPTAGLDPEERLHFRNLIAQLSDERVVILSTHIVSDVEMVATGIALLSRGRLLGHRTPEEWLRPVAGRVWRWVVPNVAVAGIQESFPGATVARRPDGVHVRLVATERPSPEAKSAEPTLEDAYMDAVAKAVA
jgi:ABC-type multidrug transport system ATPase subunit